MVEVSKKGGKSRNQKTLLKDLPVVMKEREDYDDSFDEMKNRGANSAPMLYLFFGSKANRFELAEVAADGKAIHLCADNLSMALFSFMSVFYVFHIGYAPEHESLLSFLQVVFLGDKDLSTRVNVGVRQFLAKFEEKKQHDKEMLAFKKVAWSESAAQESSGVCMQKRVSGAMFPISSCCHRILA